MPLGSYTADARNAAQPLDTVSGGFAAREIRALKTLVLALEHDDPTDSTGSGGAYVVTDTVFPSSPATGTLYWFRANHASIAGTNTLAPNGGSAVNITRIDGSNLRASDIIASQVCWIYKTGTDFLLINPNINDASTTLRGIVQLVNTVVSTSTTEALTAAQGKVLKDLIDTLQNELDTEEAALVTHKSSADHDSRYYTETEIDAKVGVDWPNLDGAVGQVFNVAAPTSDNHAVRRGSLGTEGTPGSLELATIAEIQTGTDPSRAISPLRFNSIRKGDGVAGRMIFPEAIVGGAVRRLLASSSVATSVFPHNIGTSLHEVTGNGTQPTTMLEVLLKEFHVNAGWSGIPLIEPQLYINGAFRTTNGDYTIFGSPANSQGGLEDEANSAGSLFDKEVHDDAGGSQVGIELFEGTTPSALSKLHARILIIQPSSASELARIHIQVYQPLANSGGDDPVAAYYDYFVMPTDLGFVEQMQLNMAGSGTLNGEVEIYGYTNYTTP